MADKKLNEVTKVTDMAYVPVIMSDGSIGQIAKADLASVVAGIMGINCVVNKISNTNPGAGSVDLFYGLTRGVVFLTLNTTSNNGRFDCMIYIINSNNMRVVLRNDGSEYYYQSLSLKNGTLTIANTGYGVGEFTAIHIG